MPRSRLTRIPACYWPLLLAVLLAGCAAQPAVYKMPATLAGCEAWFAAADDAVTRAGVRDVQAARLQGSPHLRVDRLLATLAREGLDGDAYETWLDHTARLARTGWEVELSNLPAESRQDLAASTRTPSLKGMAATCIDRMRMRDANDPARADEILDSARVADAYVDWQRVVGLYPLTRWPVLSGYYRWRDEINGLHRMSLDQLPITGELRRYATPVSTSRSATGGWSHDALGYPVIDADRQAALFADHSPVWVVDTVSEDDSPGRPYWPEDGEHAAIESTRPSVYHHLSYTRVAGEILPQLNYLLWFPARTPYGEGDIYAGRLDGLLFRVTLDREGEPLLYDAIHPCGCYHMFFPGPRLTARPEEEVGGEGFYVPQPAPSPGPGERLALRLEAGTHQLVRLHTVPDDLAAETLVSSNYNDLRSIVRGGRRQSLYGPDGLVAGTGRSERYLLWPMGVPSAGAMRQWGHHATMFVGRRHFDDPGMVEAGFRVLPVVSPAGG